VNLLPACSEKDSLLEICITATVVNKEKNSFSQRGWKNNSSRIFCSEFSSLQNVVWNLRIQSSSTEKNIVHCSWPEIFGDQLYAAFWRGENSEKNFAIWIIFSVLLWTAVLKNFFFSANNYEQDADVYSSHILQCVFYFWNGK